MLNFGYGVVQTLALGVVFVLEIAEVVQPVPQNRTADRRAELPVLDRHDFVSQRIGALKRLLAEIAPEQPGRLVRARLRDDIDLDAGRSALRGVEPIGDKLELRDRIRAESRLIAGAKLGGDLLTVQVQLEFTRLSAIPVRQWRARIGRDVRLPGASNASAIQFRPRAGQILTCFGSMLPPSFDVVVSMSGASPVTVTVSCSVDGRQSDS